MAQKLSKNGGKQAGKSENYKAEITDSKILSLATSVESIETDASATG